jgi:putative ABC transport system ATP-binding protein
VWPLQGFANSPKILLADEPTGNLDSKNGRHILDLMTELHRKNKVTLVLVTHDIELARRSDRQIVLRDGLVISDEANHRDAETQRDILPANTRIFANKIETG